MTNQPSNDGATRLLSTKEAAEFIGIKPATLEHWRWENVGPPYLKVGRAVRYRKLDLILWLEGQQVEPQPSSTTTYGGINE